MFKPEKIDAIFGNYQEEYKHQQYFGNKALQQEKINAQNKLKFDQLEAKIKDMEVMFNLMHKESSMKTSSINQMKSTI